MPELPEIETIKRGLQPVKNAQILEIFRSKYNLRFASSEDLENLEENLIKDIARRARYLLIKLSNKKTLVIHLGMSGRINLSSEFNYLKHDHFALRLSINQWLIFNDARRFGFVDLVKDQDLKNHKLLKDLAVEPLSDEFNADYLWTKLRTKTTNIKSTMMDNKIVVGVGNIYINESLFDARISPRRPANSLSKNEINKLVKSIKKIIDNAIENGGSSISDYQNANGELGFFQNFHKVYDRANQECVVCNSKIQRIVQNQRSTFYCPNCQKK